MGSSLKTLNFISRRRYSLYLLKVYQNMDEEQILCSNTYKNLSAEQWANYAQEIETELGLYKYMARVCGFILLNLIFIAIIMKLPTRRRSRKEILSNIDEETTIWRIFVPPSKTNNSKEDANNNAGENNQKVVTV